MNKARKSEFFRRLAEHDPAPSTELVYETPFQLLVAVILSAQATDVGVNKVTGALFARAPDACAMLALGERGLRKHIKSIGLFNTKARNIIAACRILVDVYDGEVPSDRARLEALPGVGRKTANVVLNVAFGQPTIAVDTHIFRVGNRTGLAPGRTPLAVEQALIASVPPRYRQHAHHWLILHGRYTCTARKPSCGACPVFDLCEWPERRAHAGGAERHVR